MWEGSWNFLKSEPLPCAGFRPSGLGPQCLLRARHWPCPFPAMRLRLWDYGRSLPLDVMQTRIGASHADAVRHSGLDLRRAPCKRFFPGEPQSLHTSRLVPGWWWYDTNTDTAIDSRHGSLSRRRHIPGDRGLGERTGSGIMELIVVVEQQPRQIDCSRARASVQCAQNAACAVVSSATHHPNSARNRIGLWNLFDRLHR